MTGGRQAEVVFEEVASNPDRAGLEVERSWCQAQLAAPVGRVRRSHRGRRRALGQPIILRHAVTGDVKPKIIEGQANSTNCGNVNGQQEHMPVYRLQFLSL